MTESETASTRNAGRFIELSVKDWNKRCLTQVSLAHKFYLTPNTSNG